MSENNNRIDSADTANKAQTIEAVELVHGGDIYSAIRRLGCARSEILDFSANIMPFGLTDDIRQAIYAAIDDCGSYPDPAQRALRQALAAWHALDPRQIVCGNGAADVLFRAMLAIRPQEVLLAVPTFLEYAPAAAACGAVIRTYALQRNQQFRLTRDFLNWMDNAAAPDGTNRLLVLCQPNNPTGLLIDPDLLEKILERCLQLNIHLMIDECFLDFVAQDKADAVCALPQLQTPRWSAYAENQPGLMILRSMTKFYAMPGLRFGYLCTQPELAERIAATGQPWPVGTLSEAAALAVLSQSPTQRLQMSERVWQWLDQERTHLTSALTCKGWQVLPGEANFLFFRATDQADLFDQLISKNILIRTCSNYDGLDKYDYRIAIRSPHENDQFIEALSKIRIYG